MIVGILCLALYELVKEPQIDWLCIGYD